MMCCLYLTYGERFRLRKLLDSAERALLSKAQVSICFHVARSKLKEFILPLSPLSQTRKLLERLLFFTAQDIAAPKNAVESIFKELRKIYGLDQVRFEAYASDRI